MADKRDEAVIARVSPVLKLKLKKYCEKKDMSEAQAIRLALKKILHNVSTNCTQK